VAKNLPRLTFSDIGDASQEKFMYLMPMQYITRNDPNIENDKINEMFPAI